MYGHSYVNDADEYMGEYYRNYCCENGLNKIMLRIQGHCTNSFVLTNNNNRPTLIIFKVIKRCVIVKTAMLIHRYVKGTK